MSSTNQHDVTVQPLNEGHLSQALALSQALNWPYRLEDWAFALSLGTGLAVELDGRLAGTALWWPYGDDYAAAGMIIVAGDAQRRGIGAALMDRLLIQTEGRVVILNSTLEGRALYDRKGFAALGTSVHQHQAVLASCPVAGHDVSMRALHATDMAAIRKLDAAASGMDRTALIDALFAIGTVKVLETEGQITGYGCLRRWGRGYVIGPVIAADVEQAKALIADLAAAHVGDFLRIDVPGDSGLSPWLAAIGLPDVGPVACMALGRPPVPGPGATLFALSNQSLG